LEDLEMKDVDQLSQFQAWLGYMDSALASFKLELPVELRSKLDYSVASLDALEEWLLQRYTSISDIKAKSESLFLDGSARYVGEVFRGVTRSEWSIQLDDPKRVYFGLPVLLGGKLGPAADCPITLVTASLNRRSGTYLSGIVKNFVD
jgi:hypothetical protein